MGVPLLGYRTGIKGELPLMGLRAAPETSRVQGRRVEETMKKSNEETKSNRAKSVQIALIGITGVHVLHSPV